MDAEPARLNLSLYPERPTQVLSASTGWSAINLGEVWRSHELLFSLAWRDIRARYKQTILGFIWVVIQPLMAAGLFSFIFTLVAQLKAPEGLPYFLFTFSGLVAWYGFSAVLGRSAAALVSNSVLVSKVYFPRLVLPTATVLTVLVDFLITLVPLFILTLVFWHWSGWPILVMPLCVILLWGLALGIGLCAAAIAVSYRDVLYILPVFTQFLMWGSAVMYPTQNVPEKYHWIFYLNPVVSLIEAFRWSLFDVGTVRWGYLGYSAGVIAVILLCGAIAFRRMERRFADVI